MNAFKKCSVECCDKPSLSKGLCNGHYLRHAKGKDLNSPIRRQEVNRICTAPDCKNKHYANDLCTKHWRTWNRYETKLKLIDMLGGVCKKCKQSFHPAAFDFHHLDPSKKEFSITTAFQNMSFEKIYQEVQKCILLCANCHRIEHTGDYYAK